MNQLSYRKCEIPGFEPLVAEFDRKNLALMVGKTCHAAGPEVDLDHLVDYTTEPSGLTHLKRKNENPGDFDKDKSGNNVLWLNQVCDVKQITSDDHQLT